MALVRPETLPEERPAERDASWQPLDNLPELALDHATIVDDGLWRLHARVADKVWFVRKALALLTEPFTLRQAQQLYEALRGEEVDAANFRRDVRATGLLEDTGSLRSEGPGPAGSAVPPRLSRSKDLAKRPPRRGRLGVLVRSILLAFALVLVLPASALAAGDPDRLDLRRRRRSGERDRVHQVSRRAVHGRVLRAAGGPRDDHRHARGRVPLRGLDRRLRRHATSPARSTWPATARWPPASATCSRPS